MTALILEPEDFMGGPGCLFAKPPFFFCCSPPLLRRKPKPVRRNGLLALRLSAITKRLIPDTIASSLDVDSGLRFQM